MFRFFASLFILFYLISPAYTQVITTDPNFPTVNDKVRIFFDAAQGSGGLKDCGCDIYVHTGVITSASTGTGDWKHVKTTWGVADEAWKMTKVSGQSNKYYYDISPSVKGYYGITSGEIVKKLAFVFRNANGNKEGKDVGNKDLFVDISADNNSIQYSILSPSSKNFIVNEGSIIDFKINISKFVNIDATLDGNTWFSKFDNAIDTSLIATGIGDHKVKFHFSLDSIQLFDSLVYIIPQSNKIQDLPTGIEDGITIKNDSSVILSLFAPEKSNVYVIGDFSNWLLSSSYQLSKTSDGKRWWIELNKLNKDSLYGFQYVVDNNIKIGDPYSTYVLDPDNDKYIPSGVFPNLKKYPVNKTSGIVSVFSTKKSDYIWENDNVKMPEKEKLIIYELMIRDFIGSHDYKSLTDTLEYLGKLGVNAVELMPVNEFEGNISWGYNPSYHYALEKYYGTPEQFKFFIDEAHKRGIAIILDVVYNHAFSQSPLVSLYWDSVNSRPSESSPWFNPVAKHLYNVGYDFNHESAATKYYVKRGLQNWLKEYHVDGFRFDLSKGFTQKNSTTDAQMAAYDAGRVAILEDYADYIWSIYPETFVILEHFADNSEEKVLADYGLMLWGNNNYQYNEATMGFGSDLSNMLYSKKSWNEPNLVGYMESHDEERLMYKNLKYGNGFGNYSVKDLNTALDRMKLAGTFFFLLPGPKMMWQFEELGYDYSLFTCSNGTVSNNCKLDPKPIKWDYLTSSTRKELYNTYKLLIDLKKSYDIFNSKNLIYSLTGYMKYCKYTENDMNVMTIGNFDVKSGNITPIFKHTGKWYEFFTGDSLTVSDVNVSIPLNPGEYRLYSDVKIENKYLNTAQESERYGDLIVYPNPCSDDLSIIWPEEYNDVGIDIFDIMGRKVSHLHPSLGEYDISKLNEGIYFIKTTNISKMVMTGIFVKIK